MHESILAQGSGSKAPQTPSHHFKLLPIVEGIEEEVVDETIFRQRMTTRVRILTNEPHFSQGMFNFDYKGRDFRTQLQLGNNAFYGANYIQSISPKVALGGEIFWLGHQRKSGLGLAARYNTDKSIATCQLASTGMLAMNYVQKISDKVGIATDFLYNSSTRESVCTLGYDYLFRHCRLRGRLDSNGCAAAYLEERMNLGVNFILSAEIDHWKKDYKFGFGMTVGEL
ncbi:hypothetical protein L7F22_013900 [Adiantum nelumboides]|nr:hypothetical protein [Adiantum nelumboides]